MTLDNVELTLVDSMEDVGALLQWMGNRRPYHAIGVDTETSGLDQHHDHIRLCQVGDHTHGWAFDWARWRGLFDDIIRRWDGNYILHNGPFDLGFFDRAGIHIPRSRIHDTMVQSRIVEPHMSMALKAQASRHIDSAAAGLQAELSNTKWTFANVPITYEPYWLYGALDPVLTYKLHEHHYPTVMNTAPKAYDIEMAVLWVVEKMKKYGTYVDVKLAHQKFSEFMQYCADVEDWCKRAYNVKPGSNQAIIEALQRDGVEFSKQTKSGALSLDGDVLEGINHPLATAVLGRRKAQKMASTYLKFYIDQSDTDGLVYPSFNTLGAKTGRMSCSNPNLQNLPRRGTSPFGDVVRNCIKTRYGNEWSDDRTTLTNATDATRGTLLMCDYSQIEMRMLAHFANEEAMITAFKSDDDFFVNLARQIFRDDTITKKDPRRQITKNAGYATIYSAGIAKFALTAGIPEHEAREFMQTWKQLYPNVRAFQDAILHEAVARRRSTGVPSANSPITNRIYVSDVNKEYALINYLIQGSAAEINKMKLIELDAAGLGDYMFATVHDEVLLDVPGSMTRDAVATLLSVMNDDTLLRVPIQAEASFGERWGRKNDWMNEWLND